jgi:hypothetical protein
LTPNPILKVLSTLQTCRVRHLLMGGQACVFYGAAEFSRDTDIVMLAEAGNLVRLRAALNALDAECIAVPSLRVEFLRRGHAVHFRCQHPDALGIRLDVMSVLRGVASFPQLWRRRTTLQAGSGETYDLLSLPDLVQAKKTQRDKDWPMIRRLLEAHYAQHQQHPTPKQVTFWLKEMRTPSLLTTIARRYPALLQRCLPHRPLLIHAQHNDEAALAAALETEEKQERDHDRAYWQPLRAELERLRHQRLKPNPRG